MEKNNGGELTSDLLISTKQLKEVLTSILGKNVDKRQMSDDEKKQAAYALNMCTVSVSQIIDYKDLNILEQEYDAILNNLNLEKMPKDEALLHILRQILDTITYFRIEEGDREMIEKEYQQKMKNAIWSAVPNFGLLVAGGSPLTMAVSLASQIGIGYMNYRRNKSEYALDREKQMWQLQRTAIEQFNGLRRELFDTAWRLADAYNFPDEYRLTERQIHQYNRILMDNDEQRKYERLLAIKDKFEAYPPFWYFIGNAANYIAENAELNLSEETRKQLRREAISYFEKYEELNQFNILREDQLVASCALEHIDLLLLEKKPDEKKIYELLDMAVKMSGSSFDVQEMCAIAYLKLGKSEEAARILRVLVNEDYNRIINAQLLSSIYVHSSKREEYELLATRVNPDYLYPMPSDNDDIKLLEEEFGGRQRRALKQKYKIVFDSFMQKYAVEWNKITSVFEMGNEYPESFFYDTDRARAERRNVALRVFSDRAKKENYQLQMSNANYELNMLSILNEMIGALFSFSPFENCSLQIKIEDQIKANILKHRENVNELQKAMVDNTWVLEGYILSQRISLDSIVGESMKYLLEYISKQVDSANINEITFMESDLRSFCNANGIPEPEVAIMHSNVDLFSKSKEMFSPDLFGHQAVLAKKNSEFLKDMITFIKEKMDAINVAGDEAEVFFSGDSGFNGYFYDSAFEQHQDVKSHALMVIKDKSKKHIDLLFTTDGIVDVVKGKVKHLTRYNEVKLKNDSLLFYNNWGERKYKNSSVDIIALFDLIKALGSKFVSNVDDKIEYIDEVVTVSLMNQWFKDNPEAMADDVTRIYAIPSADVLEHMGFHMEEQLDENYHLLQLFYDNNTNDILGMRIVRFEEIESNFQAKLIEQNGLIKVGK